MKDNKTYSKPIGGELIDLSLPHREDFRLKKFIENYDAWITDYRLSLEETGDSFMVKAESVAGLSADLNEVVFEEVDRPWDDLKYQKRINRMFFFAIVDMLSSKTMTSERASRYLAEVESKIINPSTSLFPLESSETIDLVKRLPNDVDFLEKTFPEMATANMIWHALSKLVGEQLIKNPATNDQQNFSKFLDLIKSNMAIMSRVIPLQKRPIDQKDIYNAKMNSFF